MLAVPRALGQLAAYASHYFLGHHQLAVTLAAARCRCRRLNTAATLIRADYNFCA